MMPIASLLAAIVASGLLNVVLFFGTMLFTGEQPSGWNLQYVVPILSYGVLGYALALVAYAVAPHHKLASGLAMMLVMLSLLSLAAYALHLEQPQTVAHLVIGIPAMCTFAVVALVQMHKGLLELAPLPAGP